MLSDNVAQKPTMPVTPGANARRKSELVAKVEGLAIIGPSPPAFHQAQPSIARPAAIRKGADQVSSHLIDSVPCRTNQTFISQKMKKQSNCPEVIPSTGSFSVPAA